MSGRDDSQRAVIDFLADPATYGLAPGTEVSRHETHVSHIFLAGDRAYKLKKQVRFPYLDFSTLEARHAACAAEVTINRRTAPAIYLGTVAVTDEGDGRLALGGRGDPVDWLVEMRRFPDGALFTHLADAGALNRRLMEGLADGIQAFHAEAEIDRAHGGAAGILAIIDNNDASFRAAQGGLFNADDVDDLTAGSRLLQGGLAALLDARRDGGRVRHCHGDLHLANICLFDDKPTLFDAIEFNDAFARIDVLYDLAFLLMDLDLRGHRRLASFVLNRYLDRAPLDGGDLDGLALLPLFLSMRAAVRAHVGASQAAALADAAEARRRAARAREYFFRALEYLRPPPPVLIAVGGLSGSGKSRLAREIAPHLGAAPGARVVRTDVQRKRLAGIDLFDRLPPESYTPEASRRTYDACFDEVARALAVGQSVVFDAVSLKPDERAGIEALADRLKAPFLGLWADAPLAVRLARIDARKDNVSDAGAEVARRQEEMDLGDMTWTVIDSSGARKNTVAGALAMIRDRGLA
jgi:aminoglycoside phosphotransferase family enzyme/predicted kinase